ncbi:MAG: FKBP-type peptidyl-prolyl cis-trans isomerase [Pontibacterium sp.]
MKKTVWLVLVSVVLLGGCGESDEQKRFRAELIDKAVNDETRKAGVAYLAENARRAGVVTTESGLQYEVLKAGSGMSATIRDTVVVNYEGRRIDDVVFDSSYERGKPSEFPVKGVVRGWREALRKMKEGAIWKLYIPADLAYGATSPSEAIPANSALVFKVELLKVKAYKTD